MKLQAICNAGVVTTFTSNSIKAFNSDRTSKSQLKDDNGWWVNTEHIIAWTEVAEAETVVPAGS